MAKQSVRLAGASLGSVRGVAREGLVLQGWQSKKDSEAMVVLSKKAGGMFGQRQWLSVEFKSAPDGGIDAVFVGSQENIDSALKHLSEQKTWTSLTSAAPQPEVNPESFGESFEQAGDDRTVSESESTKRMVRSIRNGGNPGVAYLLTSLIPGLGHMYLEGLAIGCCLLLWDWLLVFSMFNILLEVPILGFLLLLLTWALAILHIRNVTDIARA